MNNQGFEMNESGNPSPRQNYGTQNESQRGTPHTRNNHQTQQSPNSGTTEKDLAVDLDVEQKNKSRRRKENENNENESEWTPVKHEDLDDGGGTNFVNRIVVGVRSGLYQAVVQNKKKVNILLIVVSAILYNAFLITAIIYNDNYNQDDAKGYDIEWCNGVGLLIILTAIVYWCFFYYFVLKGMFGKAIKRVVIEPIRTMLVGRRYISYVAGFLCLAGAVTFIAIDAKDQPQRLISAGGVVVILFIGLLISKHPGRIIWSQVFWGIGLQFVFGLLILRWDTGRAIFDCIGGKVSTFLGYTRSGSDFVYGYLSSGYKSGFNATTSDVVLPDIFVFRALSVIFFFCFFISLLYHYGAMMWVITKLGWFLQMTVGTTAAESMNAAANIFVGQTEAPILIKPFLDDMTKSELHAVMTGGFATIAGSVMGAYISFGINPTYLLSASIMAAPAALGMSKLFYPETKVSRTTSEQLNSISLKTEGNALDAAARGAGQAVMLIGNIIANVIAFMAFVAFLNAMIAWAGGLVGVEISFEIIMGKVFLPFAYLVGVDSEEAEDVAILLGYKTVVNEFVAYAKMIEEMDCLSKRGRAIATYGLCSFANFSSIGIQLGGIGFMAPHRRQDLANTIWYAFLAGTFCGLLNACMAGMLISEPGFDQTTYDNCMLTKNSDRMHKPFF